MRKSAAYLDPMSVVTQSDHTGRLPMLRGHKATFVSAQIEGPRRGSASVRLLILSGNR